jgi:hypothetical protein
MSPTLFLCFHFTLAELNSILAIVVVPNRDGGHLRTWTTLPWEFEKYRG